MTKNILIITGALLVLGTVGVASAKLLPWEAKKNVSDFYQSMIDRSKNPQETLARLEKKYENRAEWDRMSDSAKAKHVKEASAKFEADMKARTDAQGGPKSIGYGVATYGFMPDGYDAVLPGSEFKQMDAAWNGKIKNDDHVGVSGAYTSDYSQGVLILLTDLSNQTSYPTPTKTGPVKIISAEGDIITLESQAGDWEKFDENTGLREKISTSGGEKYRFNTETQSWMK